MNDNLKLLIFCRASVQDKISERFKYIEGKSPSDCGPDFSENTLKLFELNEKLSAKIIKHERMEKWWEENEASLT